MYGVVLMMAMSTSADIVPERCHGCRGGCYGGCYGGCWGGCYGGCWGGCYGGRGCHGCWGGGWGGCYGGGWGGCYGGCFGGGYAMGGCYGGGWGGCYGGGYTMGGCYGGMGYGGYMAAAPVMSPTYAMAVTPSYAITPSLSGAVVANGIGQNPNTTQSMYYNPSTAANQNTALITVHMPANARLFIDDKATQSQSSTRRFRTPALQPGEDYHYTLRAEMDRDGQPVTTSKTITVRAGNPTEVTLAFPEE